MIACALCNVQKDGPGWISVTTVIDQLGIQAFHIHPCTLYAFTCPAKL